MTIIKKILIEIMLEVDLEKLGEVITEEVVVEEVEGLMEVEVVIIIQDMKQIQDGIMEMILEEVEVEEVVLMDEVVEEEEAMVVEEEVIVVEVVDIQVVMDMVQNQILLVSLVMNDQIED